VALTPKKVSIQKATVLAGQGDLFGAPVLGPPPQPWPPMAPHTAEFQALYPRPVDASPEQLAHWERENRYGAQAGPRLEATVQRLYALRPWPQNKLMYLAGLRSGAHRGEWVERGHNEHFHKCLQGMVGNMSQWANIKDWWSGWLLAAIDRCATPLPALAVEQLWIGFAYGPVTDMVVEHGYVRVTATAGVRPELMGGHDCYVCTANPEEERA